MISTGAYLSATSRACFEIIGGWSREYAFCYDPEEDAIARIPWDEEVQEI